METNNLSRVRKRAKKLYSKYNLSVPVDLNTIINQKCISVCYQENQVGIDGMCQLQKNPPTIILNTEITYEPRRRFTIAHELGHICIPWHTGIDLCSLDDPYVRIQGQAMVNTQELEANAFASELLMPTEWLESSFDLNTSDLQTLTESISSKAHTSIMACFYALENVLPAGEIFFVKTDSGEFWKPFRSIDTGSVHVSIDPVSFYDRICYWKNEFKISVYNVIHYKLIPRPDVSSLSDIYLKCDSNFEEFLCAITDGEPIRAMHYMDTILKEIKDKIYVIVKIGDSFYRHFKNEDTAIRIHDYNDDIVSIYEYIKTNFNDYGQIVLSSDSTLLWIKENWRGTKIDVYPGDPHELLKKIVLDIYPEGNARRMLQTINGSISGINSMHPNASYETLQHLARLRFETDPKYKDFVAHPYYIKYITGKVASFIKNKKL